MGEGLTKRVLDHILGILDRPEHSHSLIDQLTSVASNQSLVRRLSIAMVSRLISQFGSHVERLLRRYQEDIIDQQLQLGRVADVATELYVSGCVLARLDHLVRNTPADDEREAALATGRYYLKTAARRIRRHLADLWDNDDEETTAMANSLLG